MQTQSLTLCTTISDATREAAKEFGVVQEITAAVYHEALGAVPPVWGPGSHFWMGEPYTHNGANQPICLECWQDADRFFCRMSIALTNRF